MTSDSQALPSLETYWAAGPALRHKILVLWFCQWETGNDKARELYQAVLIGKGRVESERPTRFGEDQDMW